MSRISGKTIVLREFREEDIDDIRTWVVDDTTTHMLGSVFIKPQTWEQTQQYLANIMQGGSGADFVIADKCTLNYLGQCNIMMVDSIARKAEISIVMLPQFQGKGIAAEGLSLVLDFAFSQLNLHRVYLKVAAANTRAIRLYEKMGFQLEGRLRDDLYQDGAYGDLLLYGLLRSEWNTSSNRIPK